MNIRVTLIVLIAIIVVVTVAVTTLVVPGPVNHSLHLLVPMKR
jgi:hypothetical protein